MRSYDCLRELPPTELHLDADALAQAGPYAQKIIQVLEEAARDDPRLRVILERRNPNMDQIETVYQQWLDQPDMAPALREELRGMDEDTKYDSFYRDLEFGTAGLRGVLGAGTNRMNVYVVRRATQAVADYLNGTALPKCAAIGYDSRIGSDVFAREAAAVFAAERHHRTSLSPARAGPRAELRRARAALRCRHLHHRQPQSRAVQRL